ncbi:MAG: SH3 domain-containing protein [Clostridium sp.]|nr:SH3 domain-containing protein [Clostridium sp.]
MKLRDFWIVLVVIVVLFAAVKCAFGEDSVKMTVIASQLNGRAFPTTKSRQEALFDYGDVVNSTGKWSDDHKWIEIKGGEGGTVWCMAKYLTERMDCFTASNEGRRAVKIRKTPVDGKVIGYLKEGKTVEISQVILGWGKCKSGWIDLGYLCEVEIGAQKN